MTRKRRSDASGRRLRRPGRPTRRVWLLSVGLALLGLMPGLARLLVELAGDPEAASRPGSASPLPVLVHISSGTGFAVLGAFQFPTARRRAGRAWHHRTGRILAPLGVTAALSGIWLALFYSHLRHTGELLTVLRLAFGTAMTASIIVGFIAVRRGDIVRHREWMIRGYALGLGASTQIFTLGFGGAVIGTGELATALLNGAGWVINLAIAEWVIRRGRFPRRLRVKPAVVPAQREASGTDDGLTAAAPRPTLPDPPVRPPR